ncbi:tetratricopeptide repeat protein [Desulfobacula sp.]
MKKLLFIFLIVLLLPMDIRAAEDLPFVAGICVNKANTLIQNEKIDQAIIVLEEFAQKRYGVDKEVAAQKGYDHFYIDFLLGNCLLMLDQRGDEKAFVTKAALAYERAVEKKPILSAGWLNLAKCWYELGQMEKAANAFIRGYETSDEKKPSNLYYASVCHTLSNDFEQALLVFQKLMEAHPGEVLLEWKQTLVNIYFSLNKNKQALPWIEELAEKCKGEQKKKWQEILLYQYLTLEMDQKALGYARFLARTDPCEPKWWKALTHIYLGKDKLEKGLVSILIYSFISPLSQQETNLMADLYMACNIPLTAARQYEKWIDQAPDRITDDIVDKIRKISNAYWAGYEKEAALEWIEKGIAMKIDPDLLRIKADLLFQKKDYKSAFNTYEQLTQFKKQKGFGFLMMGYSAWNEGLTLKAFKVFTAASGYPKHKKEAQKALAHLQSFSGVQ